MDSLSLIVSLLAGLLLWHFSSFPKNIQLARKTGLPIFICPVNPDNPSWLVFSSMFQPQLEAWLPSLIYERVQVAIPGWEFRCRYTVNKKLGSVFVMVTPAKNVVWVADTELAHEILVRRKDFLQLPMASREYIMLMSWDPGWQADSMLGIMSFFGSNLSSVCIPLQFNTE